MKADGEATGAAAISARKPIGATGEVSQLIPKSTQTPPIVYLEEETKVSEDGDDLFTPPVLRKVLLVLFYSIIIATFLLVVLLQLKSN